MVVPDVFFKTFNVSNRLYTLKKKLMQKSGLNKIKKTAIM